MAFFSFTPGSFVLGFVAGLVVWFFIALATRIRKKNPNIKALKKMTEDASKHLHEVHKVLQEFYHAFSSR